MSTEYFPGVPKIAFEGPKSKNPFAFKHYSPDEPVEGKPMPIIKSSAPPSSGATHRPAKAKGSSSSRRPAKPSTAWTHDHRLPRHGHLGLRQIHCGENAGRKLGWEFFGADDFRPPENIAKMKAGTPLADADRQPWLERLSRLLRSEVAAGRHPVLACSALRQAYRDTLLEGLGGIRVVYLKGDRSLIASRLQSRSGHFMPAALLDSQFAALEEPSPAHAIIADLSQNQKNIVSEILAI